MTSLVDRFFAKVLPIPLRKPWIESLLKRVMALDGVERLLSGLSDQHGFELVDSLLAETGQSVEFQGVENIPSQGRLIVISNHPVGVADVFFLLKGIGRVRADVKVVINQFGAALLPNLASLCLTVDSHSKFNDAARRQVSDELKEERAVIIFPAGGISKLTPQGIRDHYWKAGTVHFSRAAESTVLPCHISGRTSWRFLMLPRKIRAFLVARELLHPVQQKVVVKFGQPIHANELAEGEPSSVAQRLRSLVYTMK